MKALITSAVLLALLFCVPSVFGYDQEQDTYFYDKHFNETHQYMPSSDEIVVVFNTNTGLESFEARYNFERIKPQYPPHAIEAYRINRGAGMSRTLDLLNADPMIKRAAPAYTTFGGATRYLIPTQLTVQFKDWVSESRMLEVIKEAGSGVVQKHWTPGYFTIAAPENRGYFETIRELYIYDEVKFSEPNAIYAIQLDFEPDDEFYEDQWALNNTGQISSCPGCNGRDIDAEAGWEISKGDPDIVISVIDTGMDLDHPDLSGPIPGISPPTNKIIPHDFDIDDWDFADNSNTFEGRSPDDEHPSGPPFEGHGTNCMGVAAALINNGTGMPKIGVAGVCSDCRIMPLRGLYYLFGGEIYYTPFADAINYASSRRQDFDGMVISNSWNFTGTSMDNEESVIAVQDAIENAYDNDVVICHSAGNSDNSAVKYPAGYPETISVSATSPCDKLKTRDPVSCDDVDWGSSYGATIDVGAPGVYIVTTDIQGEAGSDPGDYHTEFGGTSSACPHVAGIAGVVWSIDPTLTNEQIYDIIRHSADQVGGYTYSAPTGKSLELGHGRVNLANAARIAQEEIRWAENALESSSVSFPRKYDIFNIDLDGDQDQDILTVDFGKDAVVWWENDGSGSWTKHTISTNVDGAKAVCAGDLDDDDDIDIVATGSEGGLYWWLNNGSEVFTEDYVGDPSGMAIINDIFIADINDDDDDYDDIVTAVPGGSRINWWKNIGGGDDFQRRTVTARFGGANAVHAKDLDGDGHVDVVGAAKTADKISWFENDGVGNFTEHVVESDFDGASDVYVVDMDNDDNPDILACAEYETFQSVLWAENRLDEPSDDFLVTTIINNRIWPKRIFGADLSGGASPPDIIVSSPYNNAIYWWETEELPDDFKQMTLGWDFADAWAICAADFDGDGDDDVAGTAGSKYEAITWWESDLDPALPKRESEDQIAELPKHLIVSSPYPNPFNATITIQYDLPQDCHVTIDIYDILGRHVKTLVDASQPAGSHHMIWDAADRSTGIYFYRIQAGEFTEKKKMTLLK